MKITIIGKQTANLEIKIPLLSMHVPAGFPSPAEDYSEQKLDLNELLIKHPSATFFVRAHGDSMKDAGIHSNDLLIVDRSKEATNNAIVVAVINGEFTVKRISKRTTGTYLAPENPEYEPLKITEEMDVVIWGVVTSVIHSV